MSGNSKTTTKKYASVKEFYPIYLTEHQDTVNRALHCIGTVLAGLCFITAMLFHQFLFFALMPVIMFGLAWIGHTFFEKNKPSTLKHPLLSLLCDFQLAGDLIMGKQPFRVK